MRQEYGGNTFPKQINLQTLCMYKLIHFKTPKLFVAIALHIILVVALPLQNCIVYM